MFPYDDHITYLVPFVHTSIKYLWLYNIGANSRFLNLKEEQLVPYKLLQCNLPFVYNSCFHSPVAIKDGKCQYILYVYTGNLLYLFRFRKYRMTENCHSSCYKLIHIFSITFLFIHNSITTSPIIHVLCLKTRVAFIEDQMMSKE